MIQDTHRRAARRAGYCMRFVDKTPRNNLYSDPFRMESGDPECTEVRRRCRIRCCRRFRGGIPCHPNKEGRRREENLWCTSRFRIVLHSMISQSRREEEERLTRRADSAWSARLSLVSYTVCRCASTRRERPRRSRTSRRGFVCAFSADADLR